MIYNLKINNEIYNVFKEAYDVYTSKYKVKESLDDIVSSKIFTGDLFRLFYLKYINKFSEVVYPKGVNIFTSENFLKVLNNLEKDYDKFFKENSEDLSIIEKLIYFSSKDYLLDLIQNIDDNTKFKNNLIVIDNSLDKQLSNYTLSHEFVHYLIKITGLKEKLTKEEDEYIATFVGSALAYKSSKNKKEFIDTLRKLKRIKEKNFKDPKNNLSFFHSYIDGINDFMEFLEEKGLNVNESIYPEINLKEVIYNYGMN